MDDVRKDEAPKVDKAKEYRFIGEVMTPENPQDVFYFSVEEHMRYYYMMMLLGFILVGYMIVA